MEEKCGLMSEFSERMRDSGYSERFRQEIIAGAWTGFDKIIIKQQEGIRPIHRLRSFQAEERKTKKRNKKTNWYKSGGYSTVMFCPHTPGGELAAELRKAEEDTADGRLWRVKIVETAGVTVASKYARYPWAGPCPRLDCFCCTTADGPRQTLPCDQNNCCYCIECVTCKNTGPSMIPLVELDGGRTIPAPGEVDKPMIARYWGKSGRNAYTRGQDHLAALINNNNSYSIVKHRDE